MTQTLVLLHGFAGTARSWDRVSEELDRERYLPLAIDLPGHGSASGRRPLTFEACVSAVLDAAPVRFALAGYSLGGRIALQVALAAPARVEHLSLVSSTPGIADAAERGARRKADARLSAEIEGLGADAFAELWLAQPLFAGDPPAVREAAAREYALNQPSELAAVLRGLGSGSMEPMWERLGELAMPVNLLAGERDARFCAIVERAASLISEARVTIVPGAGHALPRESPRAVAAVLNGAL